MVHVCFDAQGAVSVGAAEVAPGHSAWIVKFRAPMDPTDIGPIEEAYALMAEAAGLEVSLHRLIAAMHGPGYFATRRFDRPASGERLHMVSLSGAIEAPAHLPSSYDTFLRATRAITRRAADVVKVFRRMVFNVLAHNRDDHVRQHAYLMDASGDWWLAPAYDLTYAPGPGGEHYLDIEGEGRAPTRAHVEALAARHGIGPREASTIIEETRVAVVDWPEFARMSGVSVASSALIRKAHERAWADF